MSNADPRGFVFLVLIFWLLWSGDVQQSAPATPYEDEVIEPPINRTRHFLDFLNSTRFGDLDVGNDRWLNLSGLREENGYSWELLEIAKNHSIDQMQYALGGKADGVLSGSITNDFLPVVYQNVTGIVHGDWVRPDLGQEWTNHRRHTVNLSTLLPRGPFNFRDKFEHNITGRAGSVRIQLEESEHVQGVNASTRAINALLTIREDDSIGTWWDLSLRGVHYVKAGMILLATSSHKFHGIPALAHFTPSEYMFSTTRDLLRNTLQELVEKQEYSSDLWATQIDRYNEFIFNIPRCEYVVYLQQHEYLNVPPSNGLKDQSWTRDLLSLVEDELRDPMGAPVPTPPRLKMSMTAFSPDCGFVIESKGPPIFTSRTGGHMQGPKMEIYTRSIRHVALLFAAIIAFQIILLIRQQKDASTPSMRSRISFYSVAMLSFGDGFIFFSLIFASLLDESTFYAILGTSVFAFVSVAFFGMRFLLDIWTVQAAENARQQRQASANATEPVRNTQRTTIEASSTANSIAAVSANQAALPTHRDTGATPMIIPSDQNMDAEEQNASVTTGAATTTEEINPIQRFRQLWGQFCLLAFSFLILCMYAETWPGTIRSLFVNTLAFSYLSFWWPQIYRNTMRNCPRALRWDFVIGQSSLRLLPAIYIYAVDDNILFAQTDVRTLLGLLVWVWIQILALASQNLLGARFFIPNGWVPPAYDYHPVLREDEEDICMPIGASGSNYGPSSPTNFSRPSESKEKGKNTFDCTICSSDVEVVIVPPGGSNETAASSILTRRTYMVTPCRHVFHTPCLEGWMRYRLQCPNCREALPPL